MIQYIQKLLKKLKATEKGQGMVEYALIIAFVAAIAIFALNGKLRESINNAFEKANTNVTAATENAGNTSAPTSNNSSDGNGGGGQG